MGGAIVQPSGNGLHIMVEGSHTSVPAQSAPLEHGPPNGLQGPGPTSTTLGFVKPLHGVTVI